MVLILFTRYERTTKNPIQKGKKRNEIIGISIIGISSKINQKEDEIVAFCQEKTYTRSCLLSRRGQRFTISVGAVKETKK